MEQFEDLTRNRRRALLAVAKLQSDGKPVKGELVQDVSGLSNVVIHLGFLEGAGYINLVKTKQPKTYRLTPKGEEAVSYLRQLGPEVASELSPRRLAALRVVERTVREMGRATAQNLICKVNFGMLKALLDAGYLIRERTDPCTAYSYTLRKSQAGVGSKRNAVVLSHPVYLAGCDSA